MSKMLAQKKENGIIKANVAHAHYAQSAHF